MAVGRVVAESVDEQFLTDPTLGEARIINGQRGRGASAWCPVVEWLADSIGDGVIGVAVSIALFRIGQRLAALRDQLEADGVRVIISRGAAEALAVEHIVREGLEPDDGVDVEAAVEASFIGGGEPTELNHVGADAWLVSLFSADRARRHLVAVGTDGTVLGVLTLPIGDVEMAYLSRRDDDV